jgi:tetratricopeptide (TPR) repeat protein
LRHYSKPTLIVAGTLIALFCQRDALSQRPYDRDGDLDLDQIINSDNPTRARLDAMDASRRTTARLDAARMQLASDPERDRQIEATYEMLDIGVEILLGGTPQVAIDGYFDPLLLSFEETIAAQALPTYVARSDREGMYYILTAAGRDENVQAIGSYGPDAYYWKAMALNAIGNFDDAFSALDTALRYSPANSWLLSQQANWFQADGRLLDALAGFERAAELARLFSPAWAAETELSYALRGRAYILVELGRFEEAVLDYEECLEIDDKDRDAAVQLAYVRNVLERRRRREN